MSPGSALVDCKQNHSAVWYKMLYFRETYRVGNVHSGGDSDQTNVA